MLLKNPSKNFNKAPILPPIATLEEEGKGKKNKNKKQSLLPCFLLVCLSTFSL
jgi:hypothetical protein